MPPAFAPTISGALAGQTTSQEAPLAAFAAVTLADPNVGSDDAVTITLSGADGYLVESSAIPDSRSSMSTAAPTG